MNPSSHLRKTLRLQQNLIKRTFHTQQKTNHKMPLIVPGITTNSGNLKEEWLNKLVGKKIEESPGDATTVRAQPSFSSYPTLFYFVYRTGLADG
ncbi:hypothetical protein BDV06DRAFT_192463, partial [Aspergillus oleicola]